MILNLELNAMITNL